MKEAILEVRDLVRSFDGVRAVDGVSFDVCRGDCFGLLGPNGAGKTTTVEMLEGIRAPSAGTIHYRGEPIRRRLRDEMGIQFQTTAVPDHLSVREVLRMFGRFYSKTVPIEILSERCALGEYLDRETKKLSGGQRQRMLLAMALVNDPAVLFLDEPTTGLDPQSRRNFWSVVDRIKAEGKTILLTTHYMDEAYILCDEIAIMDRGRIIAQGPPKHLLEKHFRGKRISLPVSALGEAAHDLPWPVHRRADRLEIAADAPDEVLRWLAGHALDLSGLDVRSETLEDLFLDLTGGALRE